MSEIRQGSTQKKDHDVDANECGVARADEGNVRHRSKTMIWMRTRVERQERNKAMFDTEATQDANELEVNEIEERMHTRLTFHLACFSCPTSCSATSVCPTTD